MTERKWVDLVGHLGQAGGRVALLISESQVDKHSTQGINTSTQNLSTLETWSSP